MTSYLEQVVSEWLEQFDSGIHVILRKQEVDAFIEKHWRSALGFAVAWDRKCPVEPRPTKIEVTKEIRRQLLPD